MEEFAVGDKVTIISLGHSFSDSLQADSGVAELVGKECTISGQTDTYEYTLKETKWYWRVEDLKATS